MKILIPILMGLLGIVACQPGAERMNAGKPVFSEILSPVDEGGEPNLFVSEQGQVYLSWVAYLDDTTDALFFSRLEDEKWTPAREIARGSDWFVNWADFPSLAAFGSNPEHLAAHWLQKSAGGTYDYDVRIRLSKDGGQNWSPSFIPHRDGIAAEHGFVTLQPLDNGRIFAVWLDGRNTKGEDAADGAHAHHGAMTLRTAEFDDEGNLYEEAELDNRVCDCCQTDAAVTANGLAVVYRDRSEEEVRDISIVRKVDGRWTEPQPIHADNWKIAGCPVNGPAIAADENTVAVAWFAAPEENKQVLVAFSTDSGATFKAPIRIDDGDPIGRVDIVFTDTRTALVSWIEKVGEGGEIRLAKVNAEGKKGESIVAIPTGLSRQSGFPVLEKSGNKFLLAWTDADTVTTVKTVSFSLP